MDFESVIPLTGIYVTLVPIIYVYMLSFLVIKIDTFYDIVCCCIGLYIKLRIDWPAGRLVGWLVD